MSKHTKNGMPRGGIEGQRTRESFNSSKFKSTRRLEILRAERERNAELRKYDSWISGVSVSRVAIDTDASSRLIPSDMMNAILKDDRAKKARSKIEKIRTTRGVTILEERRFVDMFKAAKLEPLDFEMQTLIKLTKGLLKSSLVDVPREMDFMPGTFRQLGDGALVLSSKGYHGPRARYDDGSFNHQWMRETSIVSGTVSRVFGEYGVDGSDLYRSDDGPHITVAKVRRNLKGRDINVINEIAEEQGVFDEPIKVFDPIMVLRSDPRSSPEPIFIRRAGRDNTTAYFGIDQ